MAHGENSDGENDPVEQAPEPPRVNYPSFEQPLMAVQDHSLLQFPQAEVHSATHLIALLIIPLGSTCSFV